MKRNKMDYVQYVGGIVLLTLGVAFSSKAGLGTGSLDSINFALADRTGLNLSTEFQTINDCYIYGDFY